MKYLFIITGLFILTSLSAQEIDKKEKRRLEKEKREQELEKKYAATLQFVEGKRFVLEAEYLQGKYGSRVPVNSTLNFVYIDSANVIIQVGSNSGYGYNGVGGFTIEGNVTLWELKKNDKHKNLFLNINVMSNVGIYSITMSVSAERQTTAVITAVTSGRLEYSGKLVPIDKARIYKARPNY